MAAIEEAAPADAVTLYTRFRSRQEHTYAIKILSGHASRSAGISSAPLAAREGTL